MQSAFVALLVVLVLSGCGEKKDVSPDVKTFKGVGVVRTIPDSKMHVNIDHEAIDGFMDAMQMFFPVLDSALLAGIEASDSVQFDIVVENGNYAISSIDVIR